MAVINMEQKAKQKHGRYGVGNKIKMTSKWEVYVKFKPDVRPFDVVKKHKCMLLY